MYFCVTNQTEANISFANVPTNKIALFIDYILNWTIFQPQMLQTSQQNVGYFTVK